MTRSFIQEVRCYDDEVDRQASYNDFGDGVSRIDNFARLSEEGNILSRNLLGRNKQVLRFVICDSCFWCATFIVSYNLKSCPSCNGSNLNKMDVQVFRSSNAAALGAH